MDHQIAGVAEDHSEGLDAWPKTCTEMPGITATALKLRGRLKFS